MEQRIRALSTPSNYGGGRIWLLCPLLRTRERLLDELERIEEAKDAALFGQMARLLGHDRASKFW
ncbi:hypothetical protein [Cupriavidus lacunae]|uniref:hypothetical protein n=1 Tax=Cupriavidus lacunae TaxID=2666307 RepID=UPI001059200D|nr:hypothetical protein [Cupriavidus lacunae]